MLFETVKRFFFSFLEAFASLSILETVLKSDDSPYILSETLYLDGILPEDL